MTWLDIKIQVLDFVYTFIQKYEVLLNESHIDVIEVLKLVS